MIDLSEFLEAVQDRIPAVEEMIALCDTLEIGFAWNNGGPVLKANKDNRPEALALAKLFKREPFRSKVIAAKIGTPPEEPKESVEEKPALDVPIGAKIVVADAQGRTGSMRQGEPHMWTWEGAMRWYYVSDYPVPSE